MRRGRAGAWQVTTAALAVLSASASCSSCGEPPPPGFEVVARLAGDDPDAPREASGIDSLRRTATRRWTADQIRADWTAAAGPEGATYRSPALPDLAIDDVDSVLVELPAQTTSSRVMLLWSAEAALAGGDAQRNRRELRLVPDRPRTVVIGSKDLRGQAPGTLRHLFLHVPGAGDPATVIESVSLLTRSDRFAVQPSGRVRVTLGGEIRDALYLRGPGRLTVPVDAPRRAEIAFGLRTREADARARVRLVWSRGRREEALLDEAVEPDAWREFRVPLPEAGPGALTLTAEPEDPDTTVLWSSPVVLAPAVSDRPNVVLYVVDTLRADRLGLYGYPRPTAPFLDDLGRRSLVFRRAYAPASWTKPSVASLLTSLHPQTHRMGGRHYADTLPDSVATLPSRLQAHGYLTGQFSANAFSGTLSNLDHGFDVALAPDAFAELGSLDESWLVGADRLNDRILPWLTRHREDRFFLYVHSIDVHSAFGNDRAPDRAALPPADRYDASIGVNDGEIERLYRHLASLDLHERTLFIVTADHGEAFGEHGRFGHGQSVYDEEVRVPLVVHWPGRLTPGWHEAPVHLVDVLPTVLDLCAIPFDPGAIQGRSLVAGATGGGTAPVFVTRFIFPDNIDVEPADRLEANAVIEFPWKLVVADRAAGEPRVELYQLAEDPLEQHDRAAGEPERVRRLSQRLERFLRDQAGARARFVREHEPDQAGASERVPAPEVMEQLRSLGYVR